MARAPKIEYRRLTDDESELVKSNMRLVGFVVKKLKSKAIEHKDQFQVGYFALSKAAQTYNAAKGAFSTYAIRCIKNELRNAFRNSSQIRIPKYLQEKGGSDRMCFPEAVKARRIASLNAITDRYDDHPATDDRPDPLCEQEFEDEIYNAIARLSPREQDVVRSVDIQGELPASVGRRHGVHRSTIAYVRLEAHRKLREKLQAYA